MKFVQKINLEHFCLNINIVKAYKSDKKCTLSMIIQQFSSYYPYEASIHTVIPV